MKKVFLIVISVIMLMSLVSCDVEWVSKQETERYTVTASDADSVDDFDSKGKLILTSTNYRWVYEKSTMNGYTIISFTKEGMIYQILDVIDYSTAENAVEKEAENIIEWMNSGDYLNEYLNGQYAIRNCSPTSESFESVFKMSMEEIEEYFPSSLKR